MANSLTRFEPFRDLSRFGLFRRLDDMFGPAELSTSLEEMPMPIDIAESDNAYTLKAALPGVKREDIRVSIQGARVTVQAESRREDIKKEEKAICTERYYGRQYRSLTLDHEIDDAKADARYHDGILELTLPKKTGRNGRTLAIH